MRLRLALVCLGISFAPLSVHGQWQPDGVPVGPGVLNQRSPTIISDGAGGAIIAWYTGDIYAQRVDATGVTQWAASGVPLCVAADDQEFPEIVSDGAGGAIVAWSDSRSGIIDADDIYAQRVDASGVAQWAANGVAICTASDRQTRLAVASDGAGGAFIAWDDLRNGSDTDINVQRVNAAGVPQWTADGVAVCIAAGAQARTAIVADGAGGAIVVWDDARFSVFGDVYAQRVNAAGVAQWTADGVALTTAIGDQESPTIVSDGAGGAIVAWYWNDVHAQRVNAAGVPQWTTDGVPICTAAGDQEFPVMVSDGVGGAVMAWEDDRGGAPTPADIYAQRVSASGVPQWTVDGVAVSTAPLVQFNVTIAADGASGAIVAWEDDRAGNDGLDIYAQRVSGSGVPLWEANGAAVCTAANTQLSPSIISDGADGAIVTWHDLRSGDSAIYAQLAVGPPNTVAILSFEATEVDGVVMLRSAFRSNLGVETLNVYRGFGTAAPLAVIERVNDVRDDRFEFADRDITPGQTYRYQIGVVDADGEFFSPIVTLSVDAIVRELAQNSPNPFNPTTMIRFVLAERDHVTLEIYDAAGRGIRTLVDEVRGHGPHEIAWDGRADDGTRVGSGVYFYRLRAGKFDQSRKMVLLK